MFDVLLFVAVVLILAGFTVFVYREGWRTGYADAERMHDLAHRLRAYGATRHEAEGVTIQSIPYRGEVD